jgi:phage terminase large subunit-like protein
MGDPFTVGHFVGWAAERRLDNEEPWLVEDYFARFVEDVFRGFPQCWLLVPEGNAKTTGLAGLALYHCEFRPTAFVPWAASARDQAEIGYTQARVFVESMPLASRPRCYDGYRRVQFENGSRIQVFAAGAEHADGVIPTLPLIDELHRHKNMALYRTWAGKLRKRGGQLGVISTAGEPGSEFEVTREKIREAATEVLEEGAFGRYATERVVMHEYALRGVDVFDLEAVKAANPFSKITAEYLAEKMADPTMTERHWRRFTCNLATMDDGTDPFIEPFDWDALALKRSEWGEKDSLVAGGAVVCLGGDGSRTWDTTVIAWAHKRADGCVLVDARVFSVRPDIAHHVLHQGGRIDFDDVEAFIIDRFDTFEVAEVAYDPRYLDRSMDIVEARLPEAMVAAVEPSSKLMRDALQAMFNLASEGKLRHAGDPVLAAHLANTGVDRGFSREIRRVRQIDSRLPIDAVPAMALAVWRAASHVPRPKATIAFASPW